MSNNRTDPVLAFGELKDEFYEIEDSIPIKVIYYPKYPSIARIKGNGAESLVGWFFREFCIGVLFYCACLAPGFLMIKNACSDWQDAKNGKKTML
jgi:hypothetical protein